MNKQEQHQEYKKKVREILDLPSTTWNGKIDAIADYIQSTAEQAIYDAMRHDCRIVGHVLHFPNKTEYYPGNTANGYCYKSNQAFQTGKGVCYIRETTFEDSTYAQSDIVCITPHNALTADDGVYTRQDIIDAVKQRLSECGINDPINVVVERIAEYVYQELEWQGVDVLLADSDLDEDYYSTLHDIMTNESYLVVNEYCANCQQEVTIEAQSKTMQHCPNCGAPIIACSMCDHDKCHCETCQLSKQTEE